MSAVAGQIVKAVLDELNGRKGYDNLWDELDSGLRKEIKSALVDEVREVLDRNGKP